MAVIEKTIEGPVGHNADLVSGPGVPEDVVELVMAKVRTEGLELLGDGGIIAELTKKILERALDEELTDHVGYDRGDRAGRNLGNSRNGSTPKRLLTEIGAVDLEVPRDRDGSFEPKLVPKGTTRLARFNENIIALYAAGMTTRDITKTLKRMYSVDVSADLISRVTDGVVAVASAAASFNGAVTDSDLTISHPPDLTTTATSSAGAGVITRTCGCTI